MKKPTALFKRLKKEMSELEEKKSHFDIIYALVNITSTAREIIDIYDKEKL